MAEELTLSISKKLTLEIVKPYFKQEGYKFISGGSPGFIKFTEFGYVDCYFTFNSEGDVGFSKIRLCLKEIEEPLIELGAPSTNNLQYGEGMWRIVSVGDSSKSLKEQLLFSKIKTEEQVKVHAEAVIAYMKEKASRFIEHNRYLPNVLLGVNEIISESRFLKDLVLGSSGSYFKILIISKLCNDPLFQEKLKYCDETFLEPERERWIPYYEKLKAMLPSIKPKYNI